MGNGCPKSNDIDCHHKFHSKKKVVENAAVRCCDLAGEYCVTPSECLITTYEEAEEKCTKMGMRLCTPYELESNHCCDSGCNFKCANTWAKGR